MYKTINFKFNKTNITKIITTTNSTNKILELRISKIKIFSLTIIFLKIQTFLEILIIII